MIKSAKWVKELYKLIYISEPEPAIGSFDRILMPTIKNMAPLSVEDVMGVQPMSGPEMSQKVWFECIDQNRPKLGDIVALGTKDGVKYPPLCGCCAPRWYKIYTGVEGGWVFEKDLTEAAWQELVTKLKTPPTYAV